MRDYALYSTIAVWVGTVLLFYTLWLTRQANRAAQDAVDVTRSMGEAQLRAYISFGGLRMISHREDGSLDKIFWRLHFSIKNTGATPARDVKVKRHFDIVRKIDKSPQIPPEAQTAIVPIGIGETVGIGTFDVTGQDFGAIKRGEKKFYFLCEVNYRNAINPNSSHTFRMGTYSDTITGDPEKYWDPDDPVEVRLPHLASFNENS
jgi:hypothetical protein